MRGPDPFWDQIDAHATDGVAERAVEMLNNGWTEQGVAHSLNLRVPAVEYLCVHEEYEVLPAVVRRFIRLRNFAFYSEFCKARRMIAQVRKEANRGSSL